MDDRSAGFHAGEVEPLVSKVLLNADILTANQLVLSLLTKYVDVEDNFKEKLIDSAVLSLIAAKKDDVQAIVQLLLAHLARKLRIQLALCLTRNLQSFLDRYPGYVVTPEIENVLARLAALPGTEYSELSMMASIVYNDFKAPDYFSRLNEMREFIISKTSEDVCTSRKLPLSTDYLPELFHDTDHEVRQAAREVYIRRVYRCHNFVDIKQTESNGVAAMFWTFSLRDLLLQVLIA